MHEVLQKLSFSEIYSPLPRSSKIVPDEKTEFICLFASKNFVWKALLDSWVENSILRTADDQHFFRAYNLLDLTGPVYMCVITARKRSLRRLCFYRCLSVHTGEGCFLGGGLLPPGGCFLQGVWGGASSRGSASSWGCFLQGGSLPRGVLPPRGWCLVETGPPGTATAAGGTHPTGMHSCS